MSDEWLLRQFVLYFGSHQKLIDQLPQEAVTHITTGLDFYSLPNDLMPKVLSYISLSDVRNVRSTCIRFAQAMRKQHFWHRLIAQKLEAIIQTNDWRRQQAVALRKFNTFQSPEPETLREQVEWIFRKDWYKTVDGQDGRVYLDRRTFKNTNLSNQFYKDGTLRGISWYKSAWFQEFEGDTYCIGMTADTFVYMISKDKQLTGKWRREKYGAMYEGSFILVDPLDERQFFAHGDGKWTFDDGTILEGKGVACMGEPRFILQKEEWASVTKKRRIDFQSAGSEKNDNAAN